MVVGYTSFLSTPVLPTKHPTPCSAEVEEKKKSTGEKNLGSIEIGSECSTGSKSTQKTLSPETRTERESESDSLETLIFMS